MSLKIVSACLAGVNCRYDCQHKEDADITKLVSEGKAIPVCPEQLGGLPTPRIPAERKGDKVISKDGRDVTEQYLMGANEVLKIVDMCQIKEAILKDKSPMCGCGQIYDGNFTGKLIKGDGVLTELLKKRGIKITSK